MARAFLTPRPGYQGTAFSLAIYVLRDDEPYQVASCDDDALGFTLRTLTEERQITCNDMVGVLTLDTRQWIVNPWPASPLGRRT